MTRRNCFAFIRSIIVVNGTLAARRTDRTSHLRVYLWRLY